MMSVESARSGIAGAHLVDELEVALARVRAAHRLQDARRARLQRQVRVLADGGALGHRLDHRAAEVLRVRAREADALDAVDRVARAQQLAELGVDVGQQVAPPRVDVLARAASARARPRCASCVTSARTSPGRRLTSRPRTAGTMQYEHVELQPIEICTQAWKPRSRCIGSVGGEACARRAIPHAPRSTPNAAGAEPLAEVRDRARAERDVDVGIEREEPLALRLRVAAADGDHHVGALALAARPRCPCTPRTSCPASRGSCTC